MNVLGIDYSSTSTGIVLLKDNKYSSSKLIRPNGKFDERIDEIVEGLYTYLDWLYTFGVLKEAEKIDYIGIESPALYAKGKVVDLSAGYGMIKYSLRKDGYKVVTFPPSEVKRFATGRGRATKEEMIEAVPDDDYDKILGHSDYGWEGIDDLCDAYWVAKITYDKARNGKI